MKRLPIFFRLQLYSLPVHDDLADVLNKTDATVAASREGMLQKQGWRGCKWSGSFHTGLTRTTARKAPPYGAADKTEHLLCYTFRHRRLGYDLCSGLCNHPYFTHNVLRRELIQRSLK